MILLRWSHWVVTSVQVKLISLDASSDDSRKAVERAVREVALQQAAAKSTEFVLQVLNSGVAARGYFYVVMPLCAGGSLEDLIVADVGVADSAVCWQVMRQLALAIAGMHAVDITHSDLKVAMMRIDDA
jgi:serine/threonine protein kinase